MNHVSVTAATIERITIVSDENQSSCSPRSSTYCSDARPVESSPSPIQSMPPLSRTINFGVGTYASVIMNATIPIGMLM